MKNNSTQVNSSLIESVQTLLGNTVHVSTDAEAISLLSRNLKELSQNVTEIYTKMCQITNEPMEKSANSLKSKITQIQSHMEQFESLHNQIKESKTKVISHINQPSESLQNMDLPLLIDELFISQTNAKTIATLQNENDDITDLALRTLVQIEDLIDNINKDDNTSVEYPVDPTEAQELVNEIISKMHIFSEKMTEDNDDISNLALILLDMDEDVKDSLEPLMTKINTILGKSHEQNAELNTMVQSFTKTIQHLIHEFLQQQSQIKQGQATIDNLNKKLDQTLQTMSQIRENTKSGLRLNKN